MIGFSKTCYRSLVDIEVGDVLLISNNLAYAVIYNTKICDLIYPEELKWLIILSTRKILKQMILISKNESEIYDENDEQMINSFEELPVKLSLFLVRK